MTGCVDCGRDRQSVRSPRCPSCRKEQRRKVNLATVRRYQASERGKAALSEYRKSDARRQAVARYNSSTKGRMRWSNWYWGQPGVAAAAEPMPMPYVGDSVFERARAAARISGDYSVDWGQHDILGEAVLAILEGRDPNEAVRQHRATEKAIQSRRAYVDDVGSDGRSLVVVQKESPPSRL